jgi:hypothetical protein
MEKSINPIDTYPTTEHQFQKDALQKLKTMNPYHAIADETPRPPSAPLQPFPQPIVRRELLIDAPLDHVWQLVATEDGLRQGWGNLIALEAQEGGQSPSSSS